MVVPRPFAPEDFPEMESWYTLRGLPTYPRDWFGYGMIVPGVAALFLYPTAFSRAYLEDLVTNPEASPKEVHRAVQSLAEALEGAARKIGIKYLVSWTRANGVQKVASSRGYVVDEHHDFSFCFLPLNRGS